MVLYDQACLASMEKTKMIEPKEVEAQAIEPCEIKSIDPLMMIGAGLMCLAGACTVPEARLLAGMEEMSELDWNRRMMTANWCKETGVPILPYLMDFWPHRR